MAGTKGNRNSVGNKGGKSLNDRKLAAKVRTLALTEIAKVLMAPQDNPDLYKGVLLRLAGTVLPRLNEHTGEDGESLVITISKEIAEKNETTQDTSDSSN